MAASLKPLIWIGTAWSDLKRFPNRARNKAGYQLYLVQKGQAPEDFKYMAEVGGGIYEIRVHEEGEHRVFYVAKFSEAIYVLHAFEKRTRKTSDRDIKLARRRFADLIRTRQPQ